MTDCCCNCLDVTCCKKEDSVLGSLKCPISDIYMDSRIHYSKNLTFVNNDKGNRIVFDPNGAIWQGNRKVVNSEGSLFAVGKSIFKDLEVTGNFKLATDDSGEGSTVTNVGELQLVPTTSSKEGLYIDDLGNLFYGGRRLAYSGEGGGENGLINGKDVGSPDNRTENIYLSSVLNYVTDLEFVKNGSSKKILFGDGSATFAGDVSLSNNRLLSTNCIGFNATGNKSGNFLHLRSGSGRLNFGSKTVAYLSDIPASSGTALLIDGSNSMAADTNFGGFNATNAKSLVFTPTADLFVGATLSVQLDGRLYLGPDQVTLQGDLNVFLNKGGDTMSGDLNMGSNVILAINGMTFNATDGLTGLTLNVRSGDNRIYFGGEKLAYSSEMGSGGDLSTVVKKAGDTMTGDLIMQANIKFEGDRNIEWKNPGAESYLQWLDVNHRIQVDQPNNCMIFREFGKFVWQTTLDHGQRMQLDSSALTLAVPELNHTLSHDGRNLLNIRNDSDTNNAIAQLNLQVGGSNAADPFISFDISGSGGWAVGIDNSDDDSFKISSSSGAPNLDQSTRLRIDKGSGDLAMSGGIVGLQRLVFGSTTNFSETEVHVRSDGRLYYGVNRLAFSSEVGGGGLDPTNFVLKAGDTMTGMLSMGGMPLISLPTPTNSTDAATKGYVDTRVLRSGDTMSGSLSMGNNSLTGIPTPSNSNDAANKSYVDAKVSKAGDTMTGQLNMNSQKITFLGVPTDGGDAVNKDYADNVANNKLNKNGDTMSGELNMGSQKITFVATPSDGNDATNKSYVDTSANLKVNKNGDTMTGQLNMNNQKIISLGAPSDNNDATNKTYVDGLVTNKLDTSGGTMTGQLNMNSNMVLNSNNNIMWTGANANSYLEWTDSNHRIIGNQSADQMIFREFGTFIWQTNGTVEQLRLSSSGLVSNVALTLNPTTDFNNTELHVRSDNRLYFGSNKIAFDGASSAPTTAVVGENSVVAFGRMEVNSNVRANGERALIMGYHLLHNTNVSAASFSFNAFVTVSGFLERVQIFFSDTAADGSAYTLKINGISYTVTTSSSVDSGTTGTTQTTLIMANTRKVAVGETISIEITRAAGARGVLVTDSIANPRYNLYGYFPNQSVITTPTGITRQDTTTTGQIGIVSPQSQQTSNFMETIYNLSSDGKMVEMVDPFDVDGLSFTMAEPGEIKVTISFDKVYTYNIRLDVTNVKIRIPLSIAHFELAYANALGIMIGVKIESDSSTQMFTYNLSALNGMANSIYGPVLSFVQSAF